MDDLPDTYSFDAVVHLNLLNKDRTINYLNQFIVNTLHGLMFRNYRGDRWKPISKSELNSKCANNKSLIEQWRKEHSDPLTFTEIVYDPCEIPMSKEIYDPGDANRRNSFKRINLWGGFLVKNIKSSRRSLTSSMNDVHIEPWLNYIKRCWCHNDEELTKKVLNHFCNIFRNPSERTMIHFLIKCTTNPDYLKKDPVFVPIQKILGNYHFSDIEGRGNLTNSTTENSHWSHSLIMVLRDPIPRPELIAEIIEAPTIVVKNKRHKPFSINNYINLFIYSNNFVCPRSTGTYDGDDSFRFVVLDIVPENVPETLHSIANTPIEYLFRFFMNGSL